jgi:hypothetical protein
VQQALVLGRKLGAADGIERLAALLKEPEG